MSEARGDESSAEVFDPVTLTRYNWYSWKDPSYLINNNQ